MSFIVGLLSNRKGFSSAIAEVVKELGFTCHVIPGFGKLIHFLKTAPELSLLLIDEQTFPVPYFDVQKHVSDHNRHFAVHFIQNTRASNMTLDGLEYNAYYDTIHELRPLLIKNRDYYRIIQMSGDKRSEEEKELLHKYNLRPSHLCILKYLEAHRERLFHLDSMDRFLWPSSQTDHIQTLYSYFHQLRPILAELHPSMVLDRVSRNTYCYHDARNPAPEEKSYVF